MTDIKLDKNGAELAFEIKIIVLALQLVQEGMSPYILIAGHPQTKTKTTILSFFSRMRVPIYVRAWRI